MRIPSSRLLWCLLAALLVTPFNPAEAATVKRYRLDEVRDRAVSIFWGQVVDRSTRMSVGGKMVWTDYEVAVSEHLQGIDPGARTTVSFAGGAVGDLIISIPGVPGLDVGENYVFFIQEGTRRPAATVGWGQGLFRVTRVNLGGITRDLLVSVDGEPLQITADGRITRGPAVRLENGSVEHVSLGMDTKSGRMADPVITSADGTPIPQMRNAAPEVTPLQERQWATLDDLRAFVSGRLGGAR